MRAPASDRATGVGYWSVRRPPQATSHQGPNPLAQAVASMYSPITLRHKYSYYEILAGRTRSMIRTGTLFDRVRELLTTQWRAARIEIVK